MHSRRSSELSSVVSDESELLDEWVAEQRNSLTGRRDLISEIDLRRESQEFLRLLGGATTDGIDPDVMSARFESLREMLSRLSATRAQQGFSPTETATFVFSAKEPLFKRLTKLGSAQSQAEIWPVMRLLDGLGIFTMETYQTTREQVIRRQQQELLELSTPVVKIWEGIVAVPLIGTLDSARTQIVMESLLSRIVEYGATIAIIDITGVPTVDTLVAQHLLKTVAAARLMGAECIISGIRPQIAQTMVHLGVSLETITKANLSDAIALALRQAGYVITRPNGNVPPSVASASFAQHG